MRNSILKSAAVLVAGLAFAWSAFAQFPRARVEPYLTEKQVPDAVVFLPPPPEEGTPQFAYDEAQYQWGKTQRAGARGIRANAIAPGFILTDMTKALSEDTLKQFVQLVPMRRGGEPEEVAKVALFLASDLSSYVSGQVIQVNGAMA